jgi:asparagine synthase (glutamine-hydrolysing)
MLEVQRDYANSSPRIERLGPAALGCALYKLLPEDAFDRQPYLDLPSRRVMLADVRVDNREELLGALGLGPGHDTSDSELLFRAYSAWGDRLYDRVVGDFAIALWDEREQSLTLARDHAGQRPLHYHIGDGFVAFASMPEGLHALEIKRAIEPSELALFLTGVRRRGGGTFFQDVAKVEPGHFLTIDRSGIVGKRFWHMPAGEVRFRKQEDYVDAFREQLDRATRARLRGSNGIAAAHLSAGLDSSAVAATAARVDPGGRIVAVTSAPRMGFSGPVPAGRIADESAYAAETAALYANMEHIVLRSAGRSPLEAIEADADLFQQPIAQPCNYTWMSALNGAAAGGGARIVLTGASGNLTISAGGPRVLADFILAGRWLSWWREARSSVGTSGWRLRGVLASSFAPWVPQPVWKALRRLGPGDYGAADLSLVSPAWHAEVEALLKAEARASGGEEGSRLSRWRMLQTADSGNYRKGALARWGIDERDPTGDRRLTEFCLSLPPEQLLSQGVNRRLARLALADRLPESVLHGPRGYQFADWYETISRSRVQRQVARLRESSGDDTVLDLDRLQHLAASWPDRGLASLDVIGTYRVALLRALAAGAFERAVRQSPVHPGSGKSGVAGQAAKL